MNKTRLEAFSDGVIAILITIMVLELRAPHGTDWKSLAPLLPNFLFYLLSFIYIGIYWNNHHHLFQATQHIRGSVLLANLNLLFWLSLIPFVTSWMGENQFASGPIALYGVILLLAASAFTILARLLVAINGKDSALAQALGRDYKSKISLAAYLVAIPLAFYVPTASCGLNFIVALLWLITDRRIERKIS